MLLKALYLSNLEIWKIWKKKNDGNIDVKINYNFDALSLLEALTYYIFQSVSLLLPLNLNGLQDDV